MVACHTISYAGLRVKTGPATTPRTPQSQHESCTATWPSTYTQNPALSQSLSAALVTHTAHPRTRGRDPAPAAGTQHPALRGVEPEGLALDAHALRQAAEEGGGALLHHVLRAQPPLDVLQQPPQEAQEVLGRADGAWHRLCGEQLSAATPRESGTRRGSRRRQRLTLQHLVRQHGVGQVGIGFPGGAGLPQALHQAAVLIPQALLVCLLDPVGRRGVGRAGAS